MGNLHFSSTLDTSDFERNLRRMNDGIRNSASIAEKEGDRITQMMKNATAAAAAYLSVTQAWSLATDIAKIRGEFQSYDIAFSTMLGNKKAALDLMNQLVETAAKTPFSLQDVTGSAKQLLAYGLEADKVNDTLIRLGDISAALNIPIGEMAYLFGTTMTQGRLYTQDLNQFLGRGIPLADELAKQFGVQKEAIKGLVEEGKVGFNEVNKAIVSMTSEGGKFGGLMSQVSTTITGQLSNLGDAWTNMLNDIGTKNEGFISDVIGGASSLIENYDDVLRILGALVATYGSYKAALIAVAAWQKSVVLVEQTLHYIRLGNAIGFATLNQKLFNRATLMNPYVAAAAAIGVLVGALILFSKRTEEVTLAQESLNKAREEGTEKYDKEAAKIKSLQSIYRNEKIGFDERKRALLELKEIVPGYHADLTKEGKLINDNTEAIRAHLEALKKEIYTKAAEDELVELFKKERQLNEKLKEARKKEAEAKKITEATPQLGSLTAGGAGAGGNILGYSIETAAVKKLEEQLKETTAAQNALNNEITELSNEKVSTSTTKGKTPEELAAEKKAREEAARALKKAKEDYKKETIEQSKKLYDEETELKRKQITDKVKIIEFERDITLAAIEAEKQAYIKLANAAGIKNPDTSVFDNRANNVRNTSKVEISNANKEDFDKLLKEYQTYEEKKKEITEKFEKERRQLILEGYTAKAEVLSEVEKDTLSKLDEEFVGKQQQYKDFVERTKDAAIETLKSELAYVSFQLQTLNLTDEQRLVLEQINKELRENISKLGKDTPKKEKDDAIKNLNEIRTNINNVIDSFDGLDEKTKEMLTSASNTAGGIITIVQGITALNKVGGEALSSVEKASVILSIASTIIQMITTIANLQQEKDQKREQAQQRELEYQNSINESLANTIRLYNEANGIFGRDNYTSLVRNAQAADKLYSDMVAKIEKENNSLLSSTGQQGGYYNRYNLNARNLEEAYNKAKALLATKTYELAGQKEYFEGIVKEYEAYKEALKEIESLMSNLVGQMGSEMTNALVDMWTNGTDAALKFGEISTKVLEDLIAQMAYSLYLAPLFDTLGASMGDIMGEKGADLTEEEKISRMADAFNIFSDGLTGALQGATDFQTRLSEILSSKGFDIFSPEGAGRSASAKGIQSISQESADRIDGMLTAVEGYIFRLVDINENIRDRCIMIHAEIVRIRENTQKLDRIDYNMNQIVTNGIKTI